MTPQTAYAALILTAFIGLCLVCFLRFIEREMNRDNQKAENEYNKQIKALSKSLAGKKFTSTTFTE